MSDITDRDATPPRADFDSALQRIDLRSVRSVWDAATELGKLRSAGETREPLEDWVFEMTAFRFATRRERGAKDPLYFGPLSTWVGKDGVAYSDPNIATVPAAALAYWERRATEAINPILIARYADLVWTLKRTVTGERPSADYARGAASAYIASAQGDWHDHGINAIFGAERALELATSINDPDLIQAAAEALWVTECADSPDTKPGLWGYSFRRLILSKVPIPENMRSEIIADMEARFVRLEKGDPWSRESAAKMLTDYYRRTGKQSEVRQLWKAVGETFERDASEGEALRASSILQHAASLYKAHDLNAEYADVTRKVASMGRKARDEMQVFSQEIEIPRAEMEKVISAHFEDTIQKTVLSITLHQMPDRDKVKSQLEQIIETNPFTYMIQQMITDHEGRTVATLRPPAQDPEPHLVQHMAQSMSFSNIVLSPLLDRFFTNYGLSAETFVDLITRSVAFSDLQKSALIAGVTAYLSRDYPTAAHILVPQIERSFRHLLETAGGSILKENTHGGFDVRTLDEILRDRILADIFGENAMFYLRTLLTNRVGWNLRNDLCHGIVPWDHFGQPAAARLIHVLMLLSLTIPNDEVM